MTAAVPFQDSDPIWQTFAGMVRVRVAGNVGQIQVSSQNADGTTFDIATIVLPGAYVRDVRKKSVTQFPSYNSSGLPTNFVTDTDRRAADKLTADSKGRVISDSSARTRPPMRCGWSAKNPIN